MGGTGRSPDRTFPTTVSRRQVLRVSLGALGGLGLAGPILAACSPRPDPAPGQSPRAAGSGGSGPGSTTKTLTWASSADVSRLIPQLSPNFVDVGVYNALFDGLTRHDLELRVHPGLATES